VRPGVGRHGRQMATGEHLGSAGRLAGPLRGGTTDLSPYQFGRRHGPRGQGASRQSVLSSVTCSARSFCRRAMMILLARTVSCSVRQPFCGQCSGGRPAARVTLVWVALPDPGHKSCCSDHSLRVAVVFYGVV